jgi:metal-sulfur cluster biosynthetic enzyme
MSPLTEKMIIASLKKVQHPAINMNLYDLGIAKINEIAPSEIVIDLCLPFAQVPRQMVQLFAQKITSVIKELDDKVSLKFVTKLMSDEERQQFLDLEKANWKGL